MHYRGIDLAPPALELARVNLQALPCAVELEQADFSKAMRNRSGDIVWISLSLHHLATPDKRALMREVRDGMSADGAFLIYEPTMRDGEDRPAYLDRFEKTGREDWTALSADEFKEAMHHVRTCDLPETVSAWVTLGREAGFQRVDELYQLARRSLPAVQLPPLAAPCFCPRGGPYTAVPVRSEVDRALNFFGLDSAPPAVCPYQITETPDGGVPSGDWLQDHADWK